MNSNFYFFWLIYIAVDGLCAVFEISRKEEAKWLDYWFLWACFIWVCARSYWGCAE